MKFHMRRDADETWTVVIGDDIEIRGFASELSAGQWIRDWIRMQVEMHVDAARKREALLAAVLEPGSKQ